jgi:hypothetical protein
VVPYLPGVKRKDINEIINRISPQEQAPDPAALEQQQQINELLLQGQQAEIENVVADTQMKEAGALERAAKAANLDIDSFKKETEATQTQLENAAMVEVPVNRLDINI